MIYSSEKPPKGWLLSNSYLCVLYRVIFTAWNQYSDASSIADDIICFFSKIVYKLVWRLRLRISRYECSHKFPKKKCLSIFCSSFCQMVNLLLLFHFWRLAARTGTHPEQRGKEKRLTEIKPFVILFQNPQEETCSWKFTLSLPPVTRHITTCLLLRWPFGCCFSFTDAA